MATPARSSTLVGAHLGAYEIVRLLGNGATASVFEGRHVALGRRVAIKVLHEHFMGGGEIAGRFLREGRIAARLAHENILEVIDLGQEGSAAWLVMEFLEGRDLRQELAQAGRLPVEEAMAILLPIASALAYAHRQGAVHRDIKPANVFLARDEHDRIVPKLVDFGLSKLDGLTEEGQSLTGVDLVAGSFAYMAPEQTHGIARAGPAADQFSFAAVVYECVVGRAPFRGRSLHELIEQVRAACVSPPSSEVATLPAALDAVILRALAGDSALRWPGMRALGAELLAFAGEETREAWKVDFMSDAQRPGRVVAPRRRSSAPVPYPRALHARGSDAPESGKWSWGSSARFLAAELSCPPLPCPAGSSPFQMKGLPYRGLVHFVNRVLPHGLDELTDALDDVSLREFVRQPFLPSSRYDVLPFRPLLWTLARLLARPFVELVRTTTESQARYDARTVFKQLFGGATLDNWHERALRFGAQYHAFGHSEVTREGPRVVMTRHEGVPEYLAHWYAPMQVAYAEAALRILGGKSVASKILPWEAAGDVEGLPTITTRSRIFWQ